MLNFPILSRLTCENLNLRAQRNLIYSSKFIVCKKYSHCEYSLKELSRDDVIQKNVNKNKWINKKKIKKNKKTKPRHHSNRITALIGCNPVSDLYVDNVRDITILARLYPDVLSLHEQNPISYIFCVWIQLLIENELLHYAC